MDQGVIDQFIGGATRWENERPNGSQSRQVILSNSSSKVNSTGGSYCQSMIMETSFGGFFVFQKGFCVGGGETVSFDPYPK
ncbi:MAG: hypothetical protein BZY73_05290 [SAR202 cluster bacterium Casp-Chloro-G3]|nr:MAG: hypothetical protein BZY73_05290 [SAR202 cluster bacterium Casp-Chloro-G3]